MLARCLRRWLSSLGSRSKGSPEMSSNPSSLSKRSEPSSTTSPELTSTLLDVFHRPLPPRSEGIDVLKRLAEWEEVLRYLEGLHLARVQEFCREQPGRSRDQIAAEARMIYLIHTWAAAPPEEEEEESNG